MSKVLIVTCGDHSDYHIVAVYTEDQQQEADKTARLIDGSVEEYPLNTVHCDDPGMDYFEVAMRRDGKSDICLHPRLDVWDSSFQKHKPDISFRTYKDDHNLKYKGKSYWRVHWLGYAKSERHAIRAANEIRRQILAGQRPTGVDMGKN